MANENTTGEPLRATLGEQLGEKGHLEASRSCSSARRRQTPRAGPSGRGRADGRAVRAAAGWASTACARAPGAAFRGARSPSRRSDGRSSRRSPAASARERAASLAGSAAALTGERKGVSCRPRVW